MPRSYREDYPGAWHHLMNRGVARAPVFYNDLDRVSFLAELSGAFIGNQIEAHAYCLMGNHYHVLVRSLEGKLSQAMQRLSSRYTHSFNQRHRRDGPLFRGRYLSVGITNDAHLLQVLRYIHLNPVTAISCDQPEDWSWSSANSYLTACRGHRGEWGQTHGSDPVAQVAGSLPLVTSELLGMFGNLPSTSYLAFMQAGVDERTLAFYRTVQTGQEPWT